MSVDVAALNHDDVSRMLAGKIEDAISSINTANEVLLADEQGTGVREIDKALKEGVEDNEEVSNAWTEAEQARETYRNALENARNLYRTQILGVEAVEESEVDKDAVKEQRKLAVEAVTLLKTYATANGLKDVVNWLNNLEIPQVGRQGSSTVGQKKPRAYVKVNGEVHNSFGEAAKAISAKLSTDDNKVSVTSPELVQAWENANEAEEFEFQGLTITVQPKNTDK